MASDPPNVAPVITSPGDETYEQGEPITPFGITVADADRDTVTVTLTGLPSGLAYANAPSGITGLRAGARRLSVPGLLSGLSASNGQVQGTVADDAAAQAHAVTVRADDGVNPAVEATFTITVTEAVATNDPTNAPPVITSPGSQTYEQGETITSFGITVSDADRDAVTVNVTGLPSGLSYTDGQVQGTVSTSAAAQAHTVTISADDRVNAAVTATFTITVTEEEEEIASNSPPVIRGRGTRGTRGERRSPRSGLPCRMPTGTR